MASPTRLSWLPEPANWSRASAAAAGEDDPGRAWEALAALAGHDLDPIRTNRLDRLLRERFGTGPPPGLATQPVRLAVLASSTVSHVIPAIRVAALRRGVWVAVYEAPYGGYLSDVLDRDSGLHRFAPSEILIALDSRHLLAGLRIGQDEAAASETRAGIVRHLREVWRQARQAFAVPLIQQTLLPLAPTLIGGNEHALPGSAAGAVPGLNAAIRAAAVEDRVDILGLDAAAAHDGVSAWHDPSFWYRAKQEVSLAAAPLYGDLVGRLLAARQGLSQKCLVLDLDNTLWGGVVGDDGVDGLRLGAGSAEGEAFQAMQAYARDLGRRGVVLAVVSKNDEAVALDAFARHPEMLLRRDDIAAFIANWDDKAQNLRRVAGGLGLGLESLVFVDDNPFERDLVRTELPMVAVPELPEDPSLWPARIAAAGYFEALAVTDDDLRRGRLYAARSARQDAAAEAADLPAFLAGLGMELRWSRFDTLGLARIVQLVNKTNQFNLTTRRTTMEEIQAVVADPDAVGLQFRLLDRFGDNGMIGVVIGRRQGDALDIETWLMSCRVLGRRVEAAMLAVVVDAARAMGAARLVGTFRPSPRNGMVREHYAGLGFAPIGREPDGTARYALDLASYAPAPGPIAIVGG